MNYIDIHGHYAWGIDDGIQSREMAEEALSKASQQHIDQIIATPHDISGKTTSEDIEHFKERIGELRELAKQYSIEIYEGCELFLNDLYLTQIRENRIIPINKTKYLLVEFDVRKEMEETTDMFYDRLFAVKNAGYKPVLAHCERYFKKPIDLDLIDDILDFGVVIQVNSSSLMHPNTIAGKNAFTLLQNNKVHLIASDTHRSKDHRYPNLDDCYKMLAKDYDEEDLSLLFRKNQAAILKEEQVENTRFVKKGLFKKRWERG